MRIADPFVGMHTPRRTPGGRSVKTESGRASPLPNKGVTLADSRQQHLKSSSHRSDISETSLISRLCRSSSALSAYAFQLSAGGRSPDVGPECIKSPKLASSLDLEASSTRRATKRIERSSPNFPDGHTASGRARRHVPDERVVMRKSTGLCVFLPGWMCRSHPLSLHSGLGRSAPLRMFFFINAAALRNTATE